MARDEGGKGEIAGEGGRGGRETTLGPTVQGEAAGRERKRRRRDGTDGTSRRAHVCVCVYLCVYARASTCIRALMCKRTRMRDVRPRVYGCAGPCARTWALCVVHEDTRGVVYARRARVCFSIPRERVWVRATRAAHECRSMYARGTYVRVCVRAFAHARLYVRPVACVPLCVHVHALTRVSETMRCKPE